MAFTRQHVKERSGLPDRTIRNYMERGLLPRPVGHGLAAEYDEDHMARAVTIGLMRAEGLHIDAIVERIAGWTTPQFKRFAARGEAAREAAAAATAPESVPVPAPVPAPAPAPASAPAPALAPAPAFATLDDVLRGEPVSPAPLRTRWGHEPIVEAELPDAPRWRIYSLLAGLGLMVDESAPPVVQRIAAEILTKYGGG